LGIGSCDNPYDQKQHFHNSDTSVERNYSKVKLYPTFLLTLDAASIQSEVFPITFQVGTVNRNGQDVDLFGFETDASWKSFVLAF
jgi:hypothetical protein